MHDDSAAAAFYRKQRTIISELLILFLQNFSN